MSAELEKELNDVVKSALKEAYAKINKIFPCGISSLNDKYDQELEQNLSTMLKDCVRHDLWIHGDAMDHLNKKGKK